MNRTDALRGHAAMLLFSALVAGSFSLGVRAANLIDPAAITVARFIIAAGVLAGIAFLMPGRGRPRALVEAPWRYLLLGGAFAGYFVLMFEGLKTAPAVAASAVFTLTPIMAAGFGWLLLRQRPHNTLFLACALSLAGVWLLTGGPQLSLNLGDALMLAAALLRAVLGVTAAS